jgi:hypothetical protein
MSNLAGSLPGQVLTPKETNDLTRVKVKIEATGHYEDMERLRNLLIELSKD